MVVTALAAITVSRYVNRGQGRSYQRTIPIKKGPQQRAFSLDTSYSATAYSGSIFASLTTFPQRGISALMNAAKASGVPPPISLP